MDVQEPTVNGAGYDDQGWRMEGEVPSLSSRSAVYLVDSHIGGRWRCTCPDYVMRRQYNGTDCKHIRLVKEAMGELQAGDGGGV